MMMDHVVYVDHATNEMDKLVKGEKLLIIRSGLGRKTPFERVKPGELLYFMNNNGDATVRAAAVVKSVITSDQMTPDESRRLLLSRRDDLALEHDQFNEYLTKKNIVLVEIKDVCRIMEFKIDKSALQNMDDWTPIENIDLIRKRTK